MDEQREWIKSRRKKRLRLLAAALAFCLLVTTYPDILTTLSAFAAGTQDGDGTVYVAGFESLPEEVREQTVPLGTGIEELTLPDALEAVVTIAEEENASENKADDSDKDKNPDDDDPKEEGTVSGAGIGTGTSGETGSAETNTETDDNGDAGADAGTGGADTGEEESGGSTETGSDNGDAGIGTGTGDGISEGGTGSGQTGVGETGIDGAGNSDAETDTAPETDKKDETPAASQEEVPAVQNNPSEETPVAGDSPSEEAPAVGDIPKEEAAPEAIEKESINQESVGTGESASRKEERETYTVTLPVYAVGNELTIETLENPSEQTETMNPPAQAGTANQTEQTETVNLPEQTEATNPPEQPETTEQTEVVTIEGVTWESVPEYDGNTEGIYVFTPVLPEGYVPAEGVSLPEIRVKVRMIGETLTPEQYARMMAGLQDSPALLTEEDVLEAAPELAPKTYGLRRAAGRAAGNPNTYLQTEDNEDNAGSGQSDRDLDQYLNATWENHPIEANIFIDEGKLPQKSCYIAVRTYDVDWQGNEESGTHAEYDKLFVNDVRVGTLTGLNNDWNTSYYQVPLSCLKEGKNTVRVEIWNCTDKSRFDADEPPLVSDGEWGVTIDWMQLVCDGGSREGIDEFSLKLQAPDKTSAQTGIRAETVIRSSNPSAVYHTEYSIVDSRGFIVGSFQEQNVPGGSHVITVNMPLHSETGTYTVQGMLKKEDGTILATDSVQFQYVKGTGPSFQPQMSHTLSIETLTNQSVTVTPVVVKEAACTEITISPASQIAESNGEYDFTVNYTDPDGKPGMIFYTVEVTNIDKTKPLIVYDSSTVISAAEAVTAGEQLKQAWTITDNVSAEENCTVTYSIDCTKTEDFKKLRQAAGSAIDITVTATDEVGNRSEMTNMVNVAPLPLEIGIPTAVRSGTTNTFVLTAEVTAAVNSVTESGFVWGAMQSPTLALNQGKAENALDVITSNRIQVNAPDIVDGVNYYCRAYAKAGGVTYYSEQTEFDIDAKSYGTFTIKNNNDNTFTITRTGGFDDDQTVWYRTVNGSAVGGLHFEHQDEKLIFKDGEIDGNTNSKSKTITIPEHAVTAIYDSKPATAYSNANRTYQVEIYRVDGGGTPGASARATREMPKDDDYKIDGTAYAEKDFVQAALSEEPNHTATSSNERRANRLLTLVKVQFCGDTGACYLESNWDDYYEETDKETAYLKETADGWYYRYDLGAFFLKVPFSTGDYMGHAYLGTGKLGTDKYELDSDNAAVSGVTGQLWAGSFKHGASLANEKAQSYEFPNSGGGAVNSGKPISANGTVVTYEGKNYVALGKTDTCYAHFGISTESTSFNLFVDSLTGHARIRDGQEPQCIGVAPMAGTTYKVGDEVVVSLIFNEIVDGSKSSLGNVFLDTSWGNFTYAGGADTNVLYFKGTVPVAAGALTVDKIEGAENIRDMCGDETTTTASGSGSVSVNVDTKTPTVSITSYGITNGTAKGTVNGTNTDTLKYAWTNSDVMPVTGWIPCVSGTEVKTRQASGKWYLHVLGTYSGTGANASACQEFDFGTPESPVAPLPSLELTVDNPAAWAKTKNITIEKTPADVSLTVKTPSGTTQDLGSRTTSYTATENGMYVFTMDVDGEPVEETVNVSRLDRTAPALTLKDAGAVQDSNGKDILYHTLRMTATAADSESGLDSVKYYFSTDSSAPAADSSVWKTATASNGIYVFTETGTDTLTTRYLHVMATDKVGNYRVAVSPAYKLVKEQRVAATLTEKAEWTKENASLTWKITEAGAGNCTVSRGATTLEEGQGANATGTFTVKENGVYSISVTDQHGNTGSALCAVSYIDREAPRFTLSVPSGYADQKAVTLSDVTDDLTKQFNTAGMKGVSGSGVVKREYQAPGESAWTPFDGDSFTAEKNGTYQVRLTDQVGNTGTESIDVSDIDVTAPKVTCTVNETQNADSGWYTGSAVSVTLDFKDEPGPEGTPSGIQTVQYKLVSGETETPVEPDGGLTDLVSDSDAFKNGSFTYEITGNGRYYLYYKVTDKAGKVTEGFSDLIQKDSYGVTAVVTGPESGKPESDGLTMGISLTYGPGGGVLYAGPEGEETVLVTMSGDSGMDIENQTVTEDYQVTDTGAYRFLYHSNAFGTDVNSDFNVCKVTFDYQGGTGNDADGSTDDGIPAQLVWHDGTEAVKCTVDKPADPVRTGYTFGGWYTDADCTGSAFDFDTQVKVDTTLYAKWTVNSYNVTYHLTKPDGSAYTPDGAFQEYTYGQGLTLPVPEEAEGYLFHGWYGNEQYAGEAFAQIGETAAGNKDYYGYYEDIKAPVITAALSNGEAADGSKWYNASGIPKIQLTYSDNKGVSDVLVKVDDGNYTSVTDITTGETTQNEMTADYELQEGVHTYTFKAEDEAGNVTETAELKVKLDKTNPEFGELSYENKAKDFLDWIIGKESLIITVPVTDNGSNGEPGSGVDEISYTLTPADGSTGAAVLTGTAKVKDGKAKITVSADFKGTVKISGNDAAGNAADDKTIGTSGGTGGVIVEDNAPTISALADRGPADMAQTGDTALSESFYKSAPAITVTIKDDTDNAVTAGIASATCLIGETDYPVTVGTDALQGEITFTIPADKIPTGSTTIEIKAEDNAGNTASFTFTLKVNGAEKKPAAKIDYQAEKLTGLEPDAPYSITYTDGNGAEQTVDVTTPDGTIPLNEEWIGDTIKIVRKGNGSETTDSEEQELIVLARPSAPSSAPELDKRTDTSVTLKRIDGVQYRVNDGDWQDSPEFTGLDPKTKYTFEVRYPAKDDAFASLPTDSTEITTMQKAPAKDSLSIDYEEEIFTLKDGVEAFTDKECTQKVNLEDGTGNAADYMGQPLYIRYPEKDGVPAGMTTKVQIPERPETPNAGTKDASYPGAQDGSITGLDDSLTYEIREKGADGSFGEWKDARLDGTEIKNLPAGEYEVRVKAEKTFRSETVSVTISEKPTTPQDKPTAVRIDYEKEKLTGFKPNETYTIKYTDGNGTEQTTEITTQDDVVSIEEKWLGGTLSIVHKGNGQDKTDSDPQEFTVPQRPAKPAPAWQNETGPNKRDGKLTGLTAGTVYEISKDGGNTWTEKRTADAAGEIKGVDAPATYVVRAAATNSGFRGPVCDPVAVDGYHIPVTFVVNGKTYDTSWAYYGKAPEKIPAVPKKADAGDKTYVGEWCADENGAPADLTNIMAEKTFYAYYTVGYNMILKGGAGYTLAAAPGSVSPVKEGGSFTLKFTLNSGYDKTDGFAVKINGVEIALEPDGTYTITDVRGNQTVTVEGIRKKASSGDSGSTGGPDGDSNDNAGGDNNPTTDTPSTDDNPSAAALDKTKPDGTKPGSTASDKTKPDGTKPGSTASDKTKSDSTTPGGTASDKTKSDSTTPGGTASDKTKSDSTTPGGTASDKTKPDGTGLTTVTVSAAIENGRIVISEGAEIPQAREAGETGATGTPGMTGAGEDGAEGVPGAAAATGTARIMTDGMNGITTVSMVLQIGSDGGGNADSAGGSVNGSNNAAGAVIVTVVCEEQAYTAGVADTVAVANAALSPEQIQLVNDGETIEVRIDVKDISSTVSGQDKEIIESGLAEYRKEMPDLTLGMYVDISMFVRNGNGSWNAVTVTEEPVEVVIGIPEDIKEEGSKFYIIRSHDGEYTLLPDLDDNPDTITISTDLFSAYAIAYEQADQADGNGKCGLCHICPTFLGICYFIWIAVIVVAFLLIWIVIWRKRKGENN